jgi:hypothetical protein
MSDKEKSQKFSTVMELQKEPPVIKKKMGKLSSIYE